MNEQTNQPPFSLDQISRVRYRLAPRLFGKIAKDISVEDKTEKLSTQEVEAKCFQVLGFLEEYYRIPSLDSQVREAFVPDDLRILESQLDAFLNDEGPTRQDQLSDRVDDINDDEIRQLKGSPELSDKEKKLGIANRREHQQQIKLKLAELLSYPQVREKFQQELSDELTAYQEARKPMRRVRKIDRVASKISKAIYKLNLQKNKNSDKKFLTSIQQEITRLQDIWDGLEQEKRGIEDAATPETLGYLKTQELLEYKRQLQENGFVKTPSRVDLLERVKSMLLSGKKVFLVGPTGTGKSQISFAVAKELTGGYELIPWHEGSNPRDVHGYPKISIDEETGQAYSHIEPGPYPRAKETGHILIHGEVTGAPTRVLLELKDTVLQDDSIHQIFTGNLNSEKQKTRREELDSAVSRELAGVEVSYMPALEMNDIILAKLIEENGVLKLGQAELKYIEQLCKAAEMMQRIHNRDFEGFTPKIKTDLGIDAQGNTETTLNANFLDPGTLFKLFNEWELARARGQNFEQYMKLKLDEFINDPKTLNVPKERKTLQKVLHIFGLVANASGEINVVIDKPDNEKGYTLPSEMAGAVALSSENPMGVALHETRTEEASELQKTEQEYWSRKLGAEVEIPPLPDYMTPDLIEKFREDPEYVGIRSFPRLKIQLTSQELEKYGLTSQVEFWSLECLQRIAEYTTPGEEYPTGVGEYLKIIEKRYPELRVFESLSHSEKNNHTVGRLLKKWYWEQVKDGKIDFPEIYNKGGWFVTEIMPKPTHRGTYERTMIGDELDHINRFDVSWNTAHEDIERNKSKIFSKLGLPSDLDLEVRMPTAAELNMLLNRMEVGIDTYEWTNTEARVGGESNRVIVGFSDLGGAAYADWHNPAYSTAFVGFRVAVVLSLTAHKQTAPNQNQEL